MAPSADPSLLAAGEELAAALLPRIVERLGDARKGYDELCARIDVGPEKALADERLLAWLEPTQREGDGLGWTLGVLACATGSDLLLARREVDALRHTAGTAALALGHQGVDVRPWPDELPRVRTGDGEGWELSLVVGLAFWRAGCRARDGAGDGSLRWRAAAGEGAWWLELPGVVFDGADEPWLDVVKRRLPELGLESRADRTLLRLPAEWIVA